MMRFIPRAIISHASALLICCLWSVVAYSQTSDGVVTVVEVKKTSGHVIYWVDSKQTKDLLFTLNRIAKKYGGDQRVIVLIDSRLPFDEAWNVEGVAFKAQLKNLRLFVVFEEFGTMSEVKRMPSISVSVNHFPN